MKKEKKEKITLDDVNELDAFQAVALNTQPRRYVQGLSREQALVAGLDAAFDVARIHRARLVKEHEGELLALRRRADDHECELQHRIDMLTRLLEVVLKRGSDCQQPL